jgi:hypothetical protein
MLALEHPNQPQEADLGISEQTRACPECGKVLTLRGLHGHLRLAHKKSSKEIGKLANKAKVAPLGKMEEVFALLDQLQEIDDRLARVDKLRAAGAFSDDGTYEEFWETLVGQEREILEELKKHGVARPTN